jgi:hypothetical protein
MSFDNTASDLEGTVSNAPRRRFIHLPAYERKCLSCHALTKNDPIQRRRTVMFDLINEEYLRGILDDITKQSKPLSRDDFYTLYRRDIRSGYAVEVDEAARRYFAKRKQLGGIKAPPNQG